MAQEAENGFGNPPQVPESWGFHILTAINNLRVELEAKMDRQAGEFHQEIGTVRQEIGSLRQEMHGEIGTLRQEMHGEIGTLSQEIGRLDSKIDGKFDILDGKIDTLRYWAIGTIVAVILTAGTIIVTMR
ncbi:MAG TPA: hypothetical protein VMW83_13065 [Spirochaetia bacterium]|nr:hypothetical protein [Spirochaetia bacterium]